MEEIIVDAIFEEDGIRYGTVSTAALVFGILEEIIGLNKMYQMVLKIKENPNEPFHFFKSFHQYVVLVMYDPSKMDNILGDTRLSMKLSDYGNSTDNALDDYLKNTEIGWTTEQKATVMKLFAEIQSSNANRIPMKANFHLSP